MEHVVGAGALLALVVVSGVLLVRRPRHPVSIVLAVMTGATALGLVAPPRFVNALWGLAVLPLSALLVAFPDGPRGPGWRRTFRYLVVVIAVAATLAAFPSLADTWVFVFSGVLAASVIPVAVAAVISLVRLWLQAVGERRWRIGLVLVAGGLLVAPHLLLPLAAALEYGLGADLERPEAVLDALFLGTMFTLVPLAVGVSMLLEPGGRRWGWVERFWPWLLGGAAAVLVGGTVGEAALALGVDPGEPQVVAATSVLVAGCVGGVGVLLRRAPSRLRAPQDHATAVLRELADRLRSAPEVGAVPDLVTRTVGQALGLRGAALDLCPSGRVERLSAWGELDDPLTVRPLVHAGERVGQLVIAPQRDGVLIDPVLLDPLLPSVAGTVAAAGLLQRLTEAHQYVREVRIDERARLRTDLHDGLSPSLAGVRLTLNAARAQLSQQQHVMMRVPDQQHRKRRSGPDATSAVTRDVDALLGRAEAELGRAGALVRGILDDLKPDAMTTDGLVAAVRSRSADFNRPGVFAVSVKAGAALPRLSPSVELAVLRVANEAVCNAARHSCGTACQVSLSLGDGGLALTVTDDGAGIAADHHAGVGLESMTMRAITAGGSLSVTSAPGGGTTVSAWFPADTHGASERRAEVVTA